ncbi:MAG TPA: serine hydrolase domain-containing protein [Thermoanaerobaculia bacterium]|nr:serine hydrolase domain-containing protein [Thermoanaerobaculia bacterium]
MITAVAAAIALAASSASGADRHSAPVPEIRRVDGSVLTPRQVDAAVRSLMQAGRVPGLGLALVREGRLAYVNAYGMANVEKNRPLAADTVMYGASLTKLAFAYMVMQLVDEGVIDLDRPIAAYLKKPLPDYPKYADLAGDSRWKALTARILLSHTSGFPNFRFLNPDEKLDFKFDPGTRYAYSGEGINLLQFVIEEGLGRDVGAEMQRRVFERFAMKRTSMTWRDDFADNVADGYGVDGKPQPHDHRSHVRAAGSMDTTIADFARFLAGLVRGDGLSPASRAEMLRPQIAIVSAHQFPTLEPAVNPHDRDVGLSSGLGSVLFRSSFGPAFYKGGHDDWTDNLAVCVAPKESCILLLSNSMRAETIYPALVESLFGKTNLPWSWEYNPASSPAPVARR